ncbi:MAG: diguanylate cyclase [Candidatus Eremiobacteraeota bacterium]|nr:diguanylate cyclase [Candidatus Eremiobacteraeota bacterium]
METQTRPEEAFGKRFAFLGHQNIQVQVGSYVLYIAKNKNSRADKLYRIISQGISENEKCIFAGSDSTKKEITSLMKKHGRPVEQLTRHSQLLIVDAPSSLRGKSRGDLEGFFEKLQGFIDDTCLQGWSSLRVIVDIPWLFESDGRNRDFVEHEMALFEEFMEKRSSLLFIGFLSSTQITQKGLLELLGSHPLLLIDENYMSSISEEASSIDNLTGLFNAGHIKELIKKEIVRAERYKRVCSLLIVDIDDFRHFNREMGYAKGDELLIELSAFLTKNVRSIDITGRLGGEEFCILLPETDKAGAATLSQRITRLTSEKFAGGAFPVSLTAGMASYPQDSDSAADLIEKARTGLKMAKQRRKS